MGFFLLQTISKLKLFVFFLRAHRLQFSNTKNNRFSITNNFTLSEMALSDVKTAEDLRSLMNDRLVRCRKIKTINDCLFHILVSILYDQ